ncbi:hypothetical protein AOLI_G00053910 [Acnodon oligacanthus]
MLLSQCCQIQRELREVNVELIDSSRTVWRNFKAELQRAKKLSSGSAERVSSESRAEGVNILILLQDQQSVKSSFHTSTAQERPFSAQSAPCRRSVAVRSGNAKRLAEGAAFQLRFLHSQCVWRRQGALTVAVEQWGGSELMQCPSLHAASAGSVSDWHGAELWAGGAAPCCLRRRNKVGGHEEEPNSR